MRKYSVTLVEDDADVRGRLADLITEHEQFELLDASGTMQQGLAALSQHKPDVLLTDIGLPDGSGIDIKSLAAIDLGIAATGENH